MNAIPVDRHRPEIEVRDLIDRHGLRPILFAVLGLALRRNRSARAPEPGELSDHLRRDIGLPPLEPRREYWELR